MQFRTAAVLSALLLSGAAAVRTRPAVKEAAKPVAEPVAKVASTPAKPAANASKLEVSKVASTPAKPAANASKPKVSKEKAVQDALPQLQSIMAKAQSSLARAERHHEKAVKKARAKVDALFKEQAKVMGAVVAKYQAELAEAADELSAVINASKAELAAEEAAEAKNTSIGWGGAAMEERARAGAKADAALRELRHITRKRDRDVEEATRHAVEPIEDAAQKLSRRVGDLSQLSDEAKSTLEWAVKQGGMREELLNKLNITKDPAAVEKAIEAARNMTATKLAAADKELAAAIANTTNKTNAGVQLIEKDLKNAEQVEIKRVRR